SRRRHTRFSRDWSSDVCSSDLFGHIRLMVFIRILSSNIFSRHDLFNFKILNQVKECKHEYPHQVNKLPVKANPLNHEVGGTSFEYICDRHQKNNAIQCNPTCYVKTMETGYRKEETRKRRSSLLFC